MSTLGISPKPSLGAVVRAGVIGGVIGIVINVVLYYIGAALGWFPETVILPTGTPLQVTNVLLISVAGTIGAIVVYALLNRFVNDPNRWFAIIVIVVLALMAFTPFSIPGAPMGMIVMLEIMHLVLGGALWYCLSRAV
jgi:hypothetical protein